MSYNPRPVIYAKDGTYFYIITEYSSGINRVQKVMAGPNGRFLQRDDRTWLQCGSYCRAYLDPVDAVYVADRKNRERIISSAQQMEKLRKQISIINSFMAKGDRYLDMS